MTGEELVAFLERALARYPDPRPARLGPFCVAFRRACVDVTDVTADAESRWLRTYQHHEHAAATAGYLEGLAAMRAAQLAQAGTP